MIRSHRDLGLAEVGTALRLLGRGRGAPVEGARPVGPELFGSTTFAGGASPVEAMLGGKICLASVTVGLGVGTGFGHAPGAAAARALASVAWEPGGPARRAPSRGWTRPVRWPGRPRLPPGSGLSRRGDAGGPGRGRPDPEGLALPSDAVAQDRDGGSVSDQEAWVGAPAAASSSTP
jgi:hypothetical protein